MFDISAQEFKQAWVPEGVQIKKARRPKKQITPDWILNPETARKKLFRQAEIDLEVARLYWVSGLTAKEIADQILGAAKKFRVIESIVCRLKRL